MTSKGSCVKLFLVGLKINQPGFARVYMKRSKKINRARIMREIWLGEKTSRSSIARKLKLDKSTVSNNINDLLELGIIMETEEGNAGPLGGRKPILLRINKAYGCVLGIELRPVSYTAVAMDLDGNIIYSCFEKIHTPGRRMEQRLEEIVQALRQELDRMGIRLLGVGLGLSAVVDTREARIKYSIPFGLEEELDFGKRMEKRLALPFFIDNDANACIWGELVFHRNRALQDFLFLLLEYKEPENKKVNDGATADSNIECVGLGIGIMINGKVHYGHDYSAGEFRSIFCKKGSSGQFALSLEKQARLKSDQAARKEFLRELGANISLLVNTFNLTHIILGGEFEQFGDEVKDIFNEAIRENWPYTYEYDEEKRIWFSSFGDRAVAYGAGALALNKLFSNFKLPEE